MGDYFLIPREAGTDWAILWIAAVDEPPSPPDLVLVGGSSNQQASPWESWPGSMAMARVVHREIRVTGLLPRRRYDFELLLGGRNVARADVTTLPAEMPAVGDKPFTVLLGSCFSHRQDAGGKIGKTFAALPNAATPDVKLLAGDQVYLDDPWHKFLLSFSREELRASFMDAYRSTWGQADGFARLLASGANYFISDDHEYWNNAPNFVAFARNTWSPSGRAEWWESAKSLYRTFQTPRAVTSFAVPPVSFLIVDTRIDRDGDRGNFMSPETQAAVAAWVSGLTGPGVMVIGQPILQTSSSLLKGTFTDWNLPDFKQYDALARIVGGSPQSLVVLTGDVHFGRVASARLASGKELVEIISSPMALVDEAAHGKWVEAPERFPAASASGLTRIGVETDELFNPTNEHFLTLEFTRRGPGANLRLRYWPILADASVPSSDFGEMKWERVLN